MMYISREEGTQANTHQKKLKIQGYVTAKGGTVMPMSTGRPCQIAAWPWLKSFTLHGWRCFEVGVFASSFGVILDVNMGGMESMKNERVTGFEGVSSERLLTQNLS